MPGTWAGAHYLRHHLTPLFASASEVEIGVALWIGAVAVKMKSEREAQHALWGDVSIKHFVGLLVKRIYGFDAFGVARVYYDRDRSRLMRWESDGTHREVRVKNETLSPRAHMHELRSTVSHSIRLVKDDNGNLGIDSTAVDPTAPSIWNKLLSGSRRAAVMLGVPVVERVDYPAAYLDSDVRIADDGVVELRRVGQLRPMTDDQFDVIAYFMGLWRDGKLPLDTEEDVRRFVVALALPLIRYVATGLLGVVWILGPPGAGKDFMCELAPSIWYAALAAPTWKAKFDLDQGKDELELKRNLSQAGGALYARAKEAAKRGDGFVTALIRLGGTDEVSVRAMRENEIEIDNTYTILADSAEDIPDRREVHRRTITIRARRLEEDALGELRAEVLSHATEIVASLKQMVEQQKHEYWTQQRNTNGRPAGQVAMGRLLSCDLDAVVGRDLSDLWDGLVYYSKSKAAPAEATEVRERMTREKQTPKVLRDALGQGSGTTIEAYRLGIVLKALKDRLCPHSVFFGPYRSAAGIATLIKREADYDTITRKHDGYLPVEHGGERYALQLVREDRYIVWMREAAYRTALGLAPKMNEGNEHDPSADGNGTAGPSSMGVCDERDDQLALVVAAVGPHVQRSPS